MPVDLHSAVKMATAKEIAIHVGDVAVFVREELDVEHVARLVEALGRRARGY